jgi:hypothetical protein
MFMTGVSFPIPSEHWRVGLMKTVIMLFKMVFVVSIDEPKSLMRILTARKSVKHWHCPLPSLLLREYVALNMLSSVCRLLLIKVGSDLAACSLT